ALRKLQRDSGRTAASPGPAGGDVPCALDRPVRRLLATADAVGGVWTYALDLARALAPRGVAVTLAVLGPEPSQAQRREAEAVAGMDVVWTRAPLDWLCDD